MKLHFRDKLRRRVVVVASGFAIAGCAAPVMQPAVPRIEASEGWRLSEGCRANRLGIRTDPDCDILTGQGIAIQVTRIRPLRLPPGEDNRSTVGIEFEPDHGSWSISAPFAALSVAGTNYAPTEVDEAIVFAKTGAMIGRLQPHQRRYDLPPGEKRFLRLRFAVPQDKLGKGFALRITGLQKEGEPAAVPLLEFQTR